MSQRIRIKLSYDGTDFCGWQKQNSTEIPSIQGTVEQALEALFNHSIKLVASGRTDAGVHALAQVAHFDTTAAIEDYNFLRALNSRLPDSISVTEAYLAPTSFHAQHSPESKTYHYYVVNSTEPSALRARYSLWEPRQLELGWLNLCSEYLVGKQDFRSFQNNPQENQSTVREVFEAFWVIRPNQELRFQITGSGFLKQMVRSIVGTQIGLFHQGAEPSEIRQILQAQDRSKALKTAAPQGLFLKSVKYPQDLDNKCRKL